MYTKLKAMIWTCIVCASGAGASGAEIQLIPKGASGAHVINGNEISMSGTGQRVELELFITDWDPDLDGDPRLRTWQVNVEAASFASGAFGRLVPPRIVCSGQPDPNEFCRSLFGGVCSLSGVACVDDTPCVLGPADKCAGSTCSAPPLNQFCEAGFIFEGRSDYIFGLAQTLAVVDNGGANGTGDFRYSALLFDPADSVTDPGQPRYAGTLFLDVPPGANGSFDITLNALLRDIIDEDILPIVTTPARITVNCVDVNDCEDDNVCTLDICQSSGLCRYRPTYDTATTCCEPVSGSLCALSSELPGDVDGSGTVDLADVAGMQTCFRRNILTSACAPLDLACDCGIAMDDYVEFNALLTGP